MLKSMVMFTFFVLVWIHPFWTNLVQKFEIICSMWHLIPKLIRVSEFDGAVNNFSVGLEISSMDNFLSPKCKNSLFKVNYFNLNTPNSLMMLIFSVLDRKYSCLLKLVPNYQCCYKFLFKLFNVCIKTNTSVQFFLSISREHGLFLNRSTCILNQY